MYGILKNVPERFFPIGSTVQLVPKSHSCYGVVNLHDFFVCCRRNKQSGVTGEGEEKEEEDNNSDEEEKKVFVEDLWEIDAKGF